MLNDTPEPPETPEPEPVGPMPIEVSARVRNLPPYLFGKINALKAEKRRAGDDVIDLGMGNPTDPPEQWVIDKLCEAAQDSRNHRYSVAQGIVQPPPRGRQAVRVPVRRRARPRRRGRHHDRLEGGVQPHVPGPARAGRHGPGPGADVPDPRRTPSPWPMRTSSRWTSPTRSGSWRTSPRCAGTSTRGRRSWCSNFPHNPTATVVEPGLLRRGRRAGPPLPVRRHPRLRLRRHRLRRLRAAELPGRQGGQGRRLRVHDDVQGLQHGRLARRLRRRQPGR